MACSSAGLKKVSCPHLTASLIGPFLKCGITDNEIFESSVSHILPTYSFKSLQVGIHSLRGCIDTLRSDEDVGPVRTNGFYPPDPEEIVYTPILGGNGVFSIITSYFRVAKENHQISVLDHSSNQVTDLGYFPAYGFYDNMRRFGCCPRGPRMLCGLTQEGNHFVLLGPLDFTKSCHSPSNETPVIAIYQISPPTRLFKKQFKDTPFIKCDPIGIALNPLSITQGQYQVAVVTKKMAILLLNVVTLQYSTLQLEFVSPQFISRLHSRHRQENCVTFSPDGRFLSILCFMDQESTAACLIVDVNILEPVCWMAADATTSWLRWLFPIFSACGTKIVFSTFPCVGEDEFDESKYELMFYKIQAIQSLKVLCRVVILEHVHPMLLGKLPLPQEMILFLGSNTTWNDESERSQSHKRRTLKCTLL